MASSILYPPIIGGYLPAFPASQAYISIPFTFSKFNSESAADLIAGGLRVHATIAELTSGANMVNTLIDGTGEATDPDGVIYTGTGIILNLIPEKNADETYSVKLYSKYFGIGSYLSGRVYKIQLRFSSVTYNGYDTDLSPIGESAWINKNAGKFSEWSTVCSLKATGQPTIKLSTLGIEVDTYQGGAVLPNQIEWTRDSLEIIGGYSNTDASETLNSYSLALQYNEEIIEHSGKILSAEYSGMNQFRYIFKREIENNKEYVVIFSYETKNLFTDTIKVSLKGKIGTSTTGAYLKTIDEYSDMINSTTKGAEEEEGRVYLLLENATIGSRYSIKRSSSDSDFGVWDQIKDFVATSASVGLYDYTAESGTVYKYSVQEVLADGSAKTIMNKTNMVMRNYDYTYLLGENNKQIKLKYDQSISSFKTVYSESNITTIGGQYPFVTRNGKSKYKNFPVTGLISMQMDDAKTFVTEEEVYGTSDQAVINYYKEYNRSKGIGENDYIYEKRFRDKVLDFLQDGKPKLYKSTTEGNIVLRLLDVSCTPNQQLGKLIYSFTSNGLEVADADIETYVKYRLCNNIVEV